MGLYCFCAYAAHLPLSWRGGQERGAVAPFLEGEGRKCPSENRAAAQSPGEGSSPVYLPSLPGGKSPSDRVTPAGPVLPRQCPGRRRARTGTDSDTVPAPCPACSTHHPCTQQAGAATPPALVAPRASAPLLGQGCVRWHWLVLDDCCGHAEGFLQALLLFQLHSDVGAVGGGQQCHLLMTERGNVRFL